MLLSMAEITDTLFRRALRCKWNECRVVALEFAKAPASLVMYVDFKLTNTFWMEQVTLDGLVNVIDVITLSNEVLGEINDFDCFEEVRRREHR